MLLENPETFSSEIPETFAEIKKAFPMQRELQVFGVTIKTYYGVINISEKQYLKVKDELW